jgi:excisionase family DNA binding protein
MSYAQDSDRDSRPDADAPASGLSTEVRHEVSDGNAPEGTRRRSAGAPARLAYRVDEACALLGVSRDTIERAVKAGRLKSGKGLGRRLIDAESLRAMYDDTSEG